MMVNVSESKVRMTANLEWFKTDLDQEKVFLLGYDCSLFQVSNRVGLIRSIQMERPHE